MRKLFSLFILLVSTITLAAPPPPVDTSIAPMLQKVMPAIVNIRAQIKITDFNTLREVQKQRQRKNTENEDLSAIPNSFLSMGSGVIIDSKNGYIITNAHVVNDAQNVIVTLSDGRHFKAKIMGVDKPSDVAILQIKAKNLTDLPLADSNKIQVGDFVAAIGSPFGLNQTVTSGIISALGRSTLGIENYENFIQTDAPINPGNSGGALLDMQGNLIGINTAILAPSNGSIGIGFSIPANMAKSVVQQLIQFGDVKRGVLGIGAEDISPELASAFNNDNVKGAAVTQVLTYSPAQNAGILEGDIITSVNGSPIKGASDVVNTIGFLRVNSKVNINLLRNKKSITVSATLSDPKVRKQLIQKMDPFFYGVGMKNFTLSSPIHNKIEGVMIISVEEDNTAWQSDLRAGDVITSINQQKIKNIDELRVTLGKAKESILVHVLRGGGALFLVMTKDS
ncbi:MAG: Do family serine endopeptidase [Gammaproteobacteria bacterium]